RSYTIPDNLITGWTEDKTNPRGAMTMARVPQPAGTIMMFEKNEGAEVNGWPYPKTRSPKDSWYYATLFENYQQCAWERHGDRINALFADGHVKALHGRRQGAFRYPPQPDDKSFFWPHLDGYVNRPADGAYVRRRA